MSKEPDFCTSTQCRDYGCDYCSECSHAVWVNEGEDINGKVWRWEFTIYYGPIFLRKDGEPLKRQPCGEDHPAWQPFEAWFKKHNKEK